LFETAADFFSLFSLASIVAVLVYSAATQSAGSTSAAEAETSGGEETGLLSETLFVVARESQDRPRVEMRYQASRLAAVDILLAREQRSSSISDVIAALTAALGETRPEEIDCLVEDPPSDELVGYFWELQDALAASGNACSVVGKLR
jgi:hypothetical protein